MKSAVVASNRSMEPDAPVMSRSSALERKASFAQKSAASAGKARSESARLISVPGCGAKRGVPCRLWRL